MWVHATLVDSTIVVNDAWAGPLSRDRAARFYLETKPIARAFGVPESYLPADLAAFDAYLADQVRPDGPVQVGPVARELAEVILHPPLPGALGRAGLDPRLYDWTLWPALGLLPRSIREAYGLRWGPLERAVSGWLTTAWRAWLPVLPPSFRQMPQALAGDRRMAGRASAAGARAAAAAAISTSSTTGSAAGTAPTGTPASRRRAS